MTVTATTPQNSVPLQQDAKVMGLVGLMHGTSHFAHLFLPPFFPFFMAEFGLSYTDVGLMMTVFFVVSGLGQASSGFLVDRVGARPVLFASLALFATAALLASQASAYWMLLLAALLGGLGNAPIHPVDFSILNQRVSPARLGHAFSVHGLTGNLGWAAAPAFLVGLATLTDWRTAYWGAFALFVLVAVVMWINRATLVTQVVVRPPEHKRMDDFEFMRQPVIWWCFGFFMLSTMTLAVVQTYAPSILQNVHGVSLEAATLTLTAYMLCGALGMVVGGFAAGRAQATERLVAVCMLVAAALMLLAATGWLGAAGTMVVLALTGFAVGIAGPSRDMMIKRATPKGATGRVYGTVYSGLDVGFAVSPLVFGALMDGAFYGLTLAGAAFTLLLSVKAALEVGKRTRAQTSQA
jgi:MFS transporter, FSR family, fosmidomycin resistance protein